ncbi:succinate dehydrogenase, hydrophobic membrane anchor protein [Celeribacter sp. SCSIO 80788]|jgi:succinate dehydrogenase / fumarate reductase membrane anchor subunit|uniref:succinate dehydrogenase, hydrophobic membrane anchor protein n=1 Tax=Celeribacter sp. SCSIO 80788 TaxID=3117013 RepID=UPI003DA3B8E0
MNFLTDRKRATGLGAGGSGVAHHWLTIATSISLIVLVPFFVFVFGSAVGREQADVYAYFSNPFIAIAMALSLVGCVIHLKTEVDEAVEDYVGGLKRKLTLIAVAAFCYALIASGLFAILKLAIL